MNKNQSLISIIMPAYNAEKYIHDAIQSVLAQTHKNWELIIINDGSQDSTETIIKNINNNKIILISQKNSGVSSARNQGLKLAKGEYITFLDADDILPPRSLESRITYMKKNPNINLVDGRIIVKDKDMINTIKEYQPYYNGNLLPKLLTLDDKVFFNVCYFLKKEIIQDTLFKNKMTHAEDLLFYIEIASKQNINYGYVNDDVYWYRSEHTSAMTNLDGLENGYIQLIQEVSKLQKIKKINFFIFKTKIAKIMFLSWLNQKQIFNAFKSIGFIYQIFNKEQS